MNIPTKIRYALLKLLVPKDSAFVFLNGVSVTGNFSLGTSCIVRNCLIRHDADAECTVIEPAPADMPNEWMATPGAIIAPLPRAG